MPIIVGHMYWYDRCPPLDGVDIKRRPVVVVVCEDAEGQPFDPMDVIGITTDPSDDHDRIWIPNQRDDRLARTGIQTTCFALPRWSLLVYRNELVSANYIGTLSGVLLYRLLEAVNARLDEPDDWDRDPTAST